MKPSTPKGTRDFTPEQALKRQYIFEVLRDLFIRFGFQPIETPAMENLSTLTGKYGEEGDRLLFKVLNNGDFLAKADEVALEARDSTKLASSISKRGLRYDLTVPFARFVVMNQNEISFPFKRYQIQPVWRADRPQKGRYQEFYQCDVDVVGSGSLMYEAELAQIYDQAFAKLGIKAVIRINNRKILAGIAESAGIAGQLSDMTVAVDKLDKIGLEGVRNELLQRDIPEASVSKIEQFLGVRDLSTLRSMLADSATGSLGVTELEQVFNFLEGYAFTNTLQFDITLARGLSYYTGCIFEVVIDAEAYPKVSMGSIGGGGRYDDLTGIFGLKNVSGVGISFGAERIYDVMEELDLFPAETTESLQLLFVSFDEASHRYAFNWLNQVRAAGIRADLYPEPTKMNKQMKYADSRNVKYVAIVGSEEMAGNTVMLKNMKTGEQQPVTFAELTDRF
jgi:histidyl-tRNA synthetase